MNIIKLFEKKDHLIKKLNISEDEKENLISFFNSHPNLDSKIDWNKKDLTYSDFENVFEIAKKSKTSIKRNGIESFKEYKDYVDVSKYFFKDTDCYAYIPLTYQFQKWFQSDNEFGPEGKWCIGYQKTDDYWNNYKYN